MSRRGLAGMLVAMALAAAGTPARAQDSLAQDGQTGTPPERIDLTITAPPPLRSTEEECRRQREAATISGEIVVCGTRPDGEDQRITSRDAAQDRYAAATQGRAPVQLPELGIFKGPATVSGICVKGIFNCPKPPAVFVDVTALPQAPPGSDADRIARGLEPLGEDRSAAPRPLSAQERAELGLPEPAPVAVNPAESATPAAPR